MIERITSDVIFSAMNLDITSQQLRRAADLKERIEELQNELSALLGETPEPNAPRKRNMSAAGRARIAAAQRARWSRFHVNGPGRAPQRKMSAAGKARLAAVARARWRKVKAAGKNTL
jgi:hypothetical protein